MNPDKQELATNDDPFTCCFGCIEVFHDFGCTVVEGQVDTHTFGGLSAHVERINGPFRAKISGYTGVGCFTGGTSIGPCDYAELFETIDAQPIDVGYFVTLEGE